MRNHKTKLREWQETTRIDQVLQQQLITVFDEHCLRGLRNMHTEYVGVATFQMLRHIYNNYDMITAVEMENNNEEMHNPYNPSLPIETLFHQIEVAVEFVGDGNRSYEKSQVVNRAYLLILRTGLYQEAYRDWDKKLDPDKTWAIFKTLFTTAYRDLRLMQTAAKKSSFHTNNAFYM